MSAISADVIKDLAPTGKVRAAINLGNPVLAQTDAAGKPAGITPELAAGVAKRLGVPLELVPFDAAGKVFDALKTGAWDIAFLAIEPVRAAEIEFTAPYVLIEGVYVVPEGSALKTIADVDQPGIRIAVAKGAAYDLYLSRTLKNATLVRSSLGPDAMDMFVADKLDAAAGVRQPAAEYVRTHPGLRIIDQRFMAIRQAMGTPKGRVAGAAFLNNFIEEMKASGFVADALKRSNQPDAVVAPPGA
ncbi:MAG TPA: ABC transporter substrate-binding protein [Pseudolabrys sp.]|nr:ABC transporter substrate-binding protein [Pseudolabrys sp.]